MDISIEINKRASRGEKMWAILIDPDKTKLNELPQLSDLINKSSCDYVLVGGSLINNIEFNNFIFTLKKKITKKVIIFPGDNSQISSYADGILLLSLISGRNPEFLIGQHVKSSFQLKEAGLCILPTGYMLIDGGGLSSVQYVSNTLPIPKDKFEIASATALAGVQLGLKYIYLDAGSGAPNPISPTMVKAIKNQVTVPLFIGGGIKTQKQLEKAWNAGADVVVIGNAIENNVSLIQLINNYLSCN